MNPISSSTNFQKHVCCPFDHPDISFSHSTPIMITTCYLCYTSISDLLKTLTKPIMDKCQKFESSNIWTVYNVLHFSLSLSFQPFMASMQTEHELTCLIRIALKNIRHHFLMNFLI